MIRFFSIFLFLLLTSCSSTWSPPPPGYYPSLYGPTDPQLQYGLNHIVSTLGLGQLAHGQRASIGIVDYTSERNPKTAWVAKNSMKRFWGFW